MTLTIQRRLEYEGDPDGRGRAVPGACCLRSEGLGRSRRGRRGVTGEEYGHDGYPVRDVSCVVSSSADHSLVFNEGGKIGAALVYTKDPINIHQQ